MQRIYGARRAVLRRFSLGADYAARVVKTLQSTSSLQYIKDLGRR